jgi:4-hydroxy-3-methylbut-2-enyl diphosphate reductase
MSTPSSELTLLTPLRTEFVSARRGAPSARVVRTGMGPARSRSAARLLEPELDTLGAVVVLGVGGGLREGQVAGDVVVASQIAEVHDGVVAEPWVSLPGADGIASLLADEELRASVGGIASSTGMLWGEASRQALAAGGALAVDMESWWLVDGLRRGAVPAPMAVVRVLLDCPGGAIASAGTVVRIPRTYRVLTRVAAVLERRIADVRAAVGLEPRGAARFAN